jgi:hypothetical protein
MKRILIGVSLALLAGGAFAQTAVVPGGDLGTSAGVSAAQGGVEGATHPDRGGPPGAAAGAAAGATKGAATGGAAGTAKGVTSGAAAGRPRLTRRQAAIDRHVGAGDEGGCVRQQEDAGVRDLFRLAEPAQRNVERQF